MGASSPSDDLRPEVRELTQNLKLERYRDWANYERLREHNIESAYHNLTFYR